MSCKRDGAGRTHIGAKPGVYGIVEAQCEVICIGVVGSKEQEQQEEEQQEENPKGTDSTWN